MPSIRSLLLSHAMTQKKVIEYELPLLFHEMLDMSRRGPLLEDQTHLIIVINWPADLSTAFSSGHACFENDQPAVQARCVHGQVPEQATPHQSLMPST